MRRVVVTGVGVISPNGIGKDSFWENTMAGKSGVYGLDRFPLDGFQARIAGHVDNFNPFDYGITHKQRTSLDRYALFALAASNEALEDSGLVLDDLDRDEVGVSIANAISGTCYMEQSFLEMTNNGKEYLNPRFASKELYQSATFNVASATVASHYQLRGPCLTISTGCTAGLDALGYSMSAIRSGKVDVMVTGAAEAPLTPVAMAAFDVIGALSSKRNDTPEKASRPFDRDRDGFVLAEGCGILVIEELSHAQKRGATIYAEVKGFGSTSNAYHMTDLPPDGTDMAHAIMLALSDASMSPEKVDYVSAHGSSTRQNDTNETAAFKSVFGYHAYNLAVSSLKSMTGHPLAAANAMEYVAAVLSIKHQQVPPTINYENQDPDCDLNYVPNEGINRKVDVVLKNASGFSGIHSAAVFTAPGYEG